MKHYRYFYLHRRVFNAIKLVFKTIIYYLSKLKFKREIFIVEVPTTMKSEQEKQKLMTDVLEILEHQIKIH
tara:strand:- start:23 stop:235 length:213 start_codon:yes stop_codon:yes gene_type:complete